MHALVKTKINGEKKTAVKREPKYKVGDVLYTYVRVPQITVCPRCNGKGKVAGIQTISVCAVCRGKGEATNPDVCKLTLCKVTVVRKSVIKRGMRDEFYYEIDGNGVFGTTLIDGELANRMGTRKEKMLYQTEEEAKNDRDNWSIYE